MAGGNRAPVAGFDTQASITRLIEFAHCLVLAYRWTRQDPSSWALRRLPVILYLKPSRGEHDENNASRVRNWSMCRATHDPKPACTAQGQAFVAEHEPLVSPHALLVGHGHLLRASSMHCGMMRSSKAHHSCLGRPTSLPLFASGRRLIHASEVGPSAHPRLPT